MCGRVAAADNLLDEANKNNCLREKRTNPPCDDDDPLGPALASLDPEDFAQCRTFSDCVSNRSWIFSENSDKYRT